MVQLAAATNWHIIGAGALGSLWGARLARSGIRVSLITRDAACGRVTVKVGDAFGAKGGEAGDPVRNWRATVYRDPLQSSIARLLVVTKAKDVVKGLRSLRSRLVPGAAVVLLGNGLPGVRDELWAEEGGCYGWDQIHIFLGSCTHGCYLFPTSGGDVRGDFRSVVHSGLGSAWLGPDVQGCATFKDACTIENELASADLGIQAVQEDEVIPLLWKKLAVNAAINAASGLVNCSNGHILRSAEGNRLMEAIIDEVAHVASAALAPHASSSLQADSLLAYAKNVAEATSQNVSSMCVDFRLGRDTEIDYINGYVARLAHNLGIDASVNRAIRDLVRLKEEAMRNAQMEDDGSQRMLTGSRL